MDIVVLDASETPFALRALYNVVASNGTVTPAERRFIEVIGELHGMPVAAGPLHAGRRGLAACHRGRGGGGDHAACKVDLSDRRDPFAVAGLPLDEVRAQYGIPDV